MLVMVPGAGAMKMEIGLNCCLPVQVKEYGNLVTSCVNICVIRHAPGSVITKKKELLKEKVTGGTEA